MAFITSSMTLGTIDTDLLATYLDPASSPWVVALAIILGTFVLEDATTVVCALAAADGRVDPLLALVSLFVGIALGDMGLFAIGRLAARHSWARRVIAMEKVRTVQSWMDSQLVSAVISTRFLPGARLPTYTACGFLGLSFRRFALAVIVGTSVWTIFLFSLTLGAGGVVMSSLSAWRWPAGLVLAALILALGRFLARRLSRTGNGESSG